MQTASTNYMHVVHDYKCKVCGLDFKSYEIVNKFFETKKSNGVVIDATYHCPKCDSQKISAVD